MQCSCSSTVQSQGNFDRLIKRQLAKFIILITSFIKIVTLLVTQAMAYGKQQEEEVLRDRIAVIGLHYNSGRSECWNRVLIPPIRALQFLGS
jgi:hypothetical protein